MEHMKRIVLATDFSDASAGAVEHALLMSKSFGSELHILHVLEVEVPRMETGGDYLPLRYFEDLETRAAVYLADLVPAEDREQLAPVPVVRRGNPFAEIIRYAQNEKIDLIIIGTHGRGALGHLMMGSVAEKVVRYAPCAVLTVHDPRHSFVRP